MIKSTLFTLLVSLSTIGLMAGDVVIKKVSPSTSSINWVGKKVTGKHTGTIALKGGELHFDGTTLVGGEFTIDMNSITVTDLEAGKGKEKLEGHLSSDDFFGVTAHPTAKLKIKTADKKSNGMYAVTGDLTIKGTSQPITFDAKVSESGATAEIVVDRTLYDVRYGSTKFGALADKAIYDDFTLNVNLNFGDVSVKAISAANSTIEWTGKKVTGKHNGTIKVKTGELHFSNDGLVGGKFVIDMTSLVVNDLEAGKGKEKLEGHLASDDFFGVEQHPTATLKFDNVTKNSDGTYKVIGDLTIKGKTNPITFNAKVNDNGANAEISVDRTIYDVRYGSTKFGALADKAIYDNFDLSVSLSMQNI